MGSKGQTILRILATLLTIGATYIIFTSKQHIVIGGFTLDASWKYSSAFVFFAYANAVSSGLSALSVLIAACGGGGNYFLMFIHDLLLTTLLMAAIAAATAVGFIGKYGNSHTGWSKICDNFGRYCNRVSIAVACSYAAVVIYLLLTILSAHKASSKSF